MRQRGFSLLEAVICTVILGMLVITVFGVFQLGTRSFRTLVVRQGVQSEARRIAVLLRRDLVVTHFRSVGTIARTSPDNPPPLNARDVLTFATLDDWSNPANFDSTLKPIWNRYLAWYGTQIDGEEEPGLGAIELGQLVRKEVIPNNPSPPILLPLPMLDPNPNTLMVSPGATCESYRILTRNLLHFSVSTDEAEQNVRVHLALRQRGFQSATGQKQDTETFECYIDLRPENTWPGL